MIKYLGVSMDHRDEWMYDGKYMGELIKEESGSGKSEPHGEGIWVRSDGDKAIGTWKKGKRHGKSKFSNL